MSRNANASPAHGTVFIEGIPVPVWPGQIRQHWDDAARAKGFRIVARVQDRYSFALECFRCQALNKIKLFVFMNNQPICQNCLEASRECEAERAGLRFARRDPTDRHYGFYEMPGCGHEVRRQFELVKRAAAGESGLRCDTCHAAKEAAEAEARGWVLIGSDPQGDPNYRLYRHGEDCGHVQRIARANMQSGRFTCTLCTDLWPSEPSNIYLFGFSLASGREVLKLGFSKDPMSRLNYQLPGPTLRASTLIDVVPMATGHDACLIENALHTYLLRNHRDCVIDPADFREQIKVKSEVYDYGLLSTITGLLGFVRRFGSR